VTNVIIIEVTVTTLLLKSLVPGSKPGTVFLDMLQFYLKLIFYTICIGKLSFVLLTFLIPALGLATVFAGVRGSYYRMDVRWPTE
jgi:hypothetical protein